MHDQHHTGPPPSVDRHCDVAVVGGSAAGLAAALQLARQRRSVIVIDAGEPRNAPASAMHGYLGREAVPPGELTAIGREEVRSYGGEVLDGRVSTVTRTDDGLRLELTGGHAVVARKVLAATGLVDDLPDVGGLDRHWGGSVVHCPFCHGYEVRDRRIVGLVTHPMGLHPASIWANLTDSLTLVLDGVDEDDAAVAALRGAGVTVISGRAAQIVDDEHGALIAVELANRQQVPADAVAVVPGFRVRVEPFEPLGLTTAAHPSGLGDVVEVDERGETSVPGLFATGNVTDPSAQVLHAAAAGSRTGAMIAVALAHEDLAGHRPPANEADWDRRYGAERMWSGNPNGSLVTEVDGLTPGRALDVGAGEGGDAIWLAERGWQVTANDISQRALGRVAAEATRRGLTVELRHADANAPEPFEPGAYDLVSAQYASIPRTRDGRGVANLLGAVAPGGTLVVVSHDLAPMRTPIDTRTHSRAFDPDAYVRVEDVLAAVQAEPGWIVEVHETRPRPTGAVSTHHVDDVVLRVRRLEH